MKNYYLLLIMLFLFSCSAEKKTEKAEETVSTVLPEKKSEVTVVTLKKQTFNHELVSNGKITARGVADLRFQSSEIVAHIYVKNGDRVRKGQKIAELDKFRLSNKLTQSKESMEKAKLELKDVLIGQGYGIDDPNKIPEETMQLAKIRSGYDQTKSQYEMAQYEYDRATLIAPFDGIVANLFAKPHNIPSTSEVFCTIIDSYGMEVDFTVLESELALIKKGDKVEVTPYSGPATRYDGSITEINPLVDDKGIVRVRAKINGNSNLFTGMNVRISVHRSLGEQLVVPKSAVVLRTGKQVIFTLKDGKAMWNYVQTGLENAEYYTLVGSDLEEGAIVIAMGNVNLAHEAPVNVIYD
ncbi:efflux RND transporter periplasmic adaptor subunit [Bacteroides sp. 224]|uniref:efflux RND transporter periplasmic adaptor subunit n=1 Tax=Bacteroides sp. 224 TaxID=2302936 RepID=UPI0013D75A1C|nr:efflux RND transporter periplasmic adaptor subunit [Bacteroides sp. 224]NDV66551.1 efflux RND transporter periplasmic adaptor subunit [Bacteroides sp. 224]